MDTEAMSAILSTLGVVGALVWHLYYNTTTTLPNLTKQYTDSQERISNHFASTQKEIADNFARTLKDERVYREQEIVALKQWIKSEASCQYNKDHS
jgi:hypothetical protein